MNERSGFEGLQISIGAKSGTLSVKVLIIAIVACKDRSNMVELILTNVFHSQH